MAWPAQPIDRNVPVDDDLYGAWLGRSVAHANLGVDASAAGDDLAVVNPAGVRGERVGAHFTAASLGYMRRAEADWRSGDSSGTISAWIKRDAIGANHAIFASADEGGNAHYFDLYIRDNNRLFLDQTDGDVGDAIYGSTPITADEWYYIALVSNGSAYFMYVNGQSETLTVFAGANTGDWLGGTTLRDNVTTGALVRLAGAGDYFDGTIKDCQYRSRVVPAEEILYEYQQGVPDESLAFWTMGGELDLSKNELAITNWTGVTTGHNMEFRGAAAESLQMPAQVLTGGMTVSLWFNASAFASTVLFNNVEHLDRRLVIKTEAAGEMRAGYWQGAVYRPASGFGYEVGRWHHAYCTWDADETVRLWLDSTELLLGVDPSSGNALTMRLGASTGGTGEFTGLMRDARVWLEDKGEDFGQRLYETHRRAY